ncbi:hypothetical protein KCT17_003692 [Escherichia coli]|nr:hypothetical protein [Escherichia coli]
MTMILDPMEATGHPRWSCTVLLSDDSVLYFPSARQAWASVPLRSSDVKIRTRAVAQYHDTARVGDKVKIDHSTITGEPVILIFTCISVPIRI